MFVAHVRNIGIKGVSMALFLNCINAGSDGFEIVDGKGRLMNVPHTVCMATSWVTQKFKDRDCSRTILQYSSFILSAPSVN